MERNEFTETTVTTRVFRPFKIIALLLLGIAIVLCIPVLASNVWIRSQTYYQGLFTECYGGERELQTGATPAPISDENPFKCSAAVPSGWLKGSKALVFISFFLSIFGFFFALAAIIRGKAWAMFFIVSGVILVFAVISILVVLIIFPVKFMLEEVVPGRGQWELGWAWGLAFGVLILQLSAAILFVFAPDKEQVYYSEKTYAH